MKSNLIVFILLVFVSVEASAMAYRGLVYDVGLQYSPGVYSVEEFNP